MIQRVSNRTELVDYETYRQQVKDGEKADLIDGVIYMASPDTKLSNTLNGFLFQLISGYIDAREIDGFVFFSRFSCKISQFRAPEPDVGYVGPGKVHLVEERHLLGGPDIAIEIVSRDSRKRDYVDKRKLYEEAGVTEYWIVDPLREHVEFLCLKHGSYESMMLEKNRIFRTTVIPGFWIDVNWLLVKPVPRAYHCLDKILASPSKKPAKRKKKP